MRIRPLREDDIAAVIALWESCGLTRPWNDPHKDINFAKQSPSSEILVGEDESQIIASVMVGHDGHRGAIYYLAVSPQHQRRGLGKEIHDAAIAWLQSVGVWKINLMVRLENTQVVSFYEKLGYSPNNVVSLARQIDTVEPTH